MTQLTRKRPHQELYKKSADWRRKKCPLSALKVIRTKRFEFKKKRGIRRGLKKSTVWTQCPPGQNKLKWPF